LLRRAENCCQFVMAEQEFRDTLPLTFPPYYDLSVSSLPSLADAETPPSYESLWNQPQERYRIIAFRVKNSFGRFKLKTRKLLMGRTQIVVYGAFVINCIILTLCFGFMAPKLGYSRNWHYVNVNDERQASVDDTCENSIKMSANTLICVCVVHILSAFVAVFFTIARRLKACVGRPYSTLVFLAAFNCLFLGAFVFHHYFIPTCTTKEIYLDGSLDVQLMVFLVLALGTNMIYILVAVMFSVLPEYQERRDSSESGRVDAGINCVYGSGPSNEHRGSNIESEDRVIGAQRVNDMSIYIERCQINPPPPYQERVA
jgi:hypothetical protein